jgi:hypothetical protein
MVGVVTVRAVSPSTDFRATRAAYEVDRLSATRWRPKATSEGAGPLDMPVAPARPGVILRVRPASGNPSTTAR